YIIENKIVDEKPYRTILILAKYYYHFCELQKKEIKQKIKAFIKNNYNRYIYNKIQWDDQIDSVVDKVKRYKLYDIDGIWVTQHELKTISKISGKTLQRLAFSLLCLAKLGNQKSNKNNNWVNIDDKTIFKLARIHCTIPERDYKLHELYKLGLVEFPRNLENLSVRLKFVNNESENKLFISDFRELGREYLKYCGENYIRCERCGLLVKGNKKGNKKFCDKCAGYLKMQTKTMICIDCGKEFEVDSMANKKTRCDECQSINRKKYMAKLMDNKRKNEKC
ncbi:MAG: hypothetical protein WCR36_11030, partial [Bacteroidaceae bacterium]